MAEGNGFLQYIYDKAAANDQYLQSVIPEDDGGTYDSFGDGGFIDSAVNATLSGAGGAIGGFGTYMDQSYGIGGSLADLGMSMQVGRQARRNWSVQEAMNNPLEYIADPNGMVYDAFNTVGSQAPDFAASYLATVATAPIGGVGGVAMKAALTAARAKMALSAASKLGKAISVGSKAGGIGLDAAKFVASKVPNLAGIVTGGFVDAASEAGNTYHTALDNGATQEEALNAMDTDFMDNIGLSTVQNAVSLSMLKGAAKAPYRLLGGAEDVAEDTAKKGILGALSEAGGKVADFADSNIATRFLTRSVPSIAVEGYTEGLQQEFQNNAVHGYDINYNPMNMSNDSIEEAGHATFGMLPMGILGAIGRRRGRASSHVGGTNDSEKTVASPIDHVVNQGVQNNVSAPPTSNVSVSDMSMTNSPIESTPIETTPVDAGELTQGDIDSIVLEAQKQAEAQAAKTATSKAAPPASGRNINDLIAQNMDNPTDTDIAERELYGKDSTNYAAYQAIANALSTETSPLGYNPVHGSANMTASEKADLINAMVNSPELTMINSPKEAAPIADVLETRNNNKVLRNQAQSLVAEKQKLGLPVTEADIATTTDVHPNKGQLQAMRVQIKDKKAQNKATFKAKKEAATNIVNTALADLEKKGASSDYYINEKGEISPFLRSQIEENGLGVEEVAPKIAKRSQKVRDEKNRVRNEAVKALNETVKADLEKNGVKSPFYSKDGTLNSLSNETKRHLTRSSMGQIDNTTLDHIAKLSALADERAAAKSEKERALKAEMDRVEKINKNDVGIHVDPKDLEGMTPSKRKEFLTRKEKQVQKVSASKKELEADIVKARELGINPKELEGKAPAERKKYLESKEKERRKNSEKDNRRKSDKTQAKLVDTNEYGVKVGDMEGMTRSQRKKHLSQKRKEIDRRKETAEKDSEKGYKEIRHDKGKEKDTSHFANALSKLAKEGKQKDVVEAVHHFINNFFEYKSLATDSIKRHFSPKFRDRVESALREYVNARTENDFNNDAQVAKVTQLVKESMEEARKPTSKAEKAPKEKSKGEERITYSTTSDQSEETKSLNLGKALKKAKSKGEDVRIASHANDMLIQELREGKPKDGRDEIHYWLHHEELTKKYEIKVPKGEPKKLNRAEILVKGYGSAKRNDGKRNVVSPFVKWVGEGPERAAGARNFPSERVIQKLIDEKVYTRGEIERARAEYEHHKDQADKNLKTKLEEMANERKELADKARADARDKNTSKTSEATITYETEPAYTVDKLGTVKSSRVNMTVKVSPSDIKDRENDAIASMLGSVYDIDVEGKNVEVISHDTVRLKDAQKMYSDGKIPDSVFESLDEDSQQIIFDSWGSELEFIPDTDVVSNSKGEDEDAVQDRPRSDAVGSDRQKDLEENVGERSDGTSEGNDPRRSDGETSSTGFGIFGQIHDASRRIGDRLDDSLKSILKTLHLTIPKGVDVDVDKFDKLIEDSFGDLTPRLQSLLENILSDMNTVVLYFGDSAKDSPLGNNYFGYNVVRVFEDALSGEGEKTILHEILHSFHGAIELGAGDKAYAINYITHDFLVNKNSELIKPEIRKVVNTLISQLKDNQVESGLTSEWNNLIYYHANEEPEVVDYVCRMIAEDPQAAKALSENPELKQELLVAKTIAQLRLTHDIPTLRAKSRDVENRILEMGRLAKKGVPNLNQKRESFLKQLGISIPFRNGKLTDKAALALKEYFDKDKNINAPKQISIKSIIKKNLDRMKVASHEETAQRSALYAAGVIPGKDKANILRRMFEDPLHFFKKYLPDGLHIYRLADEARRNMEKFVTNYSKRFSDAFDGISKKNRDRLCQLILKADELHRDPMQVIKLDNGLYIAARHDAFIEHYDEYATAMTRAKELRDSGKYRIVKTMQETEENENAGFGKGYTVFAIPKGSAVFRSEKAAQEFCNKGEHEAYESLIRSISGKDVTKEDIKAITDSYKKYRSMMDDIYTDMVTAAKESGAKYSIPKKLHGYFPHLHLPYVVWVQNQDGTYTKTSSFYNGSEASKEVKRLADKGVKAYWAEMNPINAINLQERMGKVDRMTEEQLLELDKEGSIQLNDSVSAVGDYNHALKKMVAPLFKKNEKVSVGEVMKFLEKEQRRYEKHKNTGVKEIDGFRKAALSQLKVTKLFKQLQRMKQKDMITQAELENLINSSNMNKKFNAHFQKREGASGYSKNVLDSVYRYMVTAGNFTSKAKFYAEGSAYYAQKFKKDIREEAVTDTEKFLKMYIKANHSPTSVTALDNMINDYLNLLAEKDPTGFGAMLKNHYGRGIYTGLARDTLSLQNLLKLGLFRPASLAVQAFQVLNANAKLGGNKVIGLSKYFRTGLKEAVGSKYDSKWKELYDYIGINEESVALDSELLGRSPKFTEKALVRGKSLKDFANASMIFFNAGDRWARKATAIGGYLKAVDDFKSLSKDEKKEMLDKAISSWERRKERAELNHIAFKDPKPTMESVRKEYIFNSAKDLVTETNFNYSTTDTPLAMTEAGVTGKLLLQFKKYPLFTLNFILHNSKEENIRFLVPMLIMAGCLGMPCAGLVDDIFDKTTGNSPSLVLKRHMIEWAGGSATKRALVNVALYGAPSMAGINLSQNIGLGDAIQFDLGPTVSTVTNIMGGNGVIRSLAPYLGALSDAASGEKEDRYGNLTVKYSPYDQLLKAFGFKPVTETNSMDASKVLRQAKDAYRDSLSKAKKEYIKNPNADNYQALLIYGLKDSDIAKLLKTKDTTQIEQLSKSIPKNPKNQGAREVQELAKAAQNFTK